jgi:hypothetical protein
MPSAWPQSPRTLTLPLSRRCHNRAKLGGMPMDLHGCFCAGGLLQQTRLGPLAHSESTSQAEYAGSIPVIGSTNPQFGGIFRDCQRPSQVIF